MRKLVMMLAVMALLTAFPAAAGAKKPPQPPPGQEPLPGETCADYTFDDPSLWYVGTADDDFTLTLPPESAPPDSEVRAACIDVTSLEGVWNFKIEAAGVASFNMQIKDSVPGDICWRDAWNRTEIPDVLSTWIPKATINACPGDDFSDGDSAEPDPDTNDPLVFMVGYGPEKKLAGSIVIKVNLP